MGASTEHVVTIRIETHDKQGTAAARDRVLRWLETFGHTSVGHGFDFVQMVGESHHKVIRRKDT